MSDAWILTRLSRHVNELEEENARLRDTLAQYELFTSIVGDPAVEFAKLRRDLHRYQGEHIKLREMVKNMHGWLVVNYEKSYVIPLNGLNDIERDMRELGIEVDNEEVRDQ